ncbi:MAG: family 5 extracellular solute-binding protein, peptide/nickel transport system substrate-binding protein [Candidatus Peregrinibacteria bacterium GW2011_GWF2_33_10]|nr:MAG: family 5 extracellular solute-binding protein, peptide/nickel transport system substrate-binding protein [Candidatus Peregrinibacteria bacterium GW2011_GWF2_33_10]OGJ44564.1 MAG: hypothetical protein A2263_02530 [Candidatus Peregrinibacteria bacterium RIFOXYA2_FULL_33_21]OGJ44870.1 MAG: hypothetical protein A2272_01840 [Candidatus Peregrinibacteria bacterium RIFOXYA12_FULL_33_12]OGJ50049.1 MAG: hypothetical protein A2307_01450 [Candidatus Peregrinibacteria bacterium RIFOXYB2_FULL_33_20]
MQTKELVQTFYLTIKSFSTKERYLILILSFILIFSTTKSLFNYVKADIWSNDDKSIYVEGMVGNLGVLNPLFSQPSSVDRDITALIYQGLSKYDPLTQQVVDNKSIATHSLSQNQKEYTFYLNKNATWQDGKPLTADDIIFTYRDVIQNANFPNVILKKTFDQITIEKIDEFTVVFKLPLKNSFFFTSTLIGLLPKHIWEGTNVENIATSDLNKNPIGNGPYRFDSSTQSGNLTKINLTRFDNYQGDRANILNFSFVIAPTIDDLKQNIEKIHGLARLSKFDKAELVNNRFALYKYDLPRYTALFINNDKPYLKNQKIRLAIQKAIDKQALVNEIGYEQVIDTPLLELQEDKWMFKSNKEEAMGALYDAGWKLNKDTNVRENRNGDKLTLRLLTRTYEDVKQQEINTKSVNFIKTALGNVGIDVSIESYPFSFLQYVILDRDYDLLLYGQSLEYNLDLYPYLHSSQAKDRGLNFSNYRNVKVDQLLDDLRNTFDHDTKTEKLKAIGDELEKDIPAVYLYTPYYYYLVDEKFSIGEIGELATHTDRFANITNWTKEK